MATTQIVGHEVLSSTTEHPYAYGGPEVDMLIEASRIALSETAHPSSENQNASTDRVLQRLVGEAVTVHGDSIVGVLDYQLDPEGYVAKTAGRIALLTDGLGEIEITDDGAEELSGLILAVTDPKPERGQVVVEDFLSARIETQIREILLPDLREQPKLFDTNNPDVYVVKSVDRETGETQLSVHPVLFKKLESLCDRVGVVLRDFQTRGLSREQISKIYYRVRASVLVEVAE